MNLENPSSKIVNMSKAHYTADDILNWENITPTATLNNASMEEIMYGYDQLKTRQHTLLKSGIYPKHPLYDHFILLTRIFYTPEIRHLQRRLLTAYNRLDLIKQIMNLVYTNIINNHSKCTDPWSAPQTLLKYSKSRYLHNQ